MWWWILFIGFLIASTQSFFFQVFNGLSLFGVMLVLLSACFILIKEYDK